MQTKLKNIDFWILVPFILLSALGIVMVYSASSNAAQLQGLNSSIYLKRQALFVAVGFLLCAFFYFLKIDVLKRSLFTKWFLLIVLALLIVLLIRKHFNPQASINGASAWIPIGPFHIQPLELAKLALILYLAKVYSSRVLNISQQSLKQIFSQLWPPVLVGLLITGLTMFQPDLGGAAIIAAIVFLMSFASGLDIKYVVMTVIFLIDPSTTQKLCAVIFRGTFTNKTASKTQAADFFQKYLGAYPLPKSQHQKLISSNLEAQSPYDSEIAAAHISTAPHKTTHFAVAFPLKKLYSHYELVPLTTQRQHLQAGVFTAKKTPLTNSAATGTTSTTTAKSSNSSQSTSKNVLHLTIDQKKQINADFLNWAAERATVGHMAVSDWYFDHGSAGLGDWYANTPDGQVQVQNQNQPGAAAFKIHAVGGCIFYKSKDGQIGKQNLYKGSFADN